MYFFYTYVLYNILSGQPETCSSNTLNMLLISLKMKMARAARVSAQQLGQDTSESSRCSSNLSQVFKQRVPGFRATCSRCSSSTALEQGK